jgi:hypothetical protein
MILLLVIAAWILVLSLVTGLCAVARAGDSAQPTHAPASAGWGRVQSLAWEPAEHLEIAAPRADVRPARPAESGASLLRSGGVAA